MITEDAEYIWKVTWEENHSWQSSSWASSWATIRSHAKAFTNKREALMYACELENDTERYRNVEVIKWFGNKG